MHDRRATNQPSVLVVGAGPAGLAVAACLLRRNVLPVVVERADDVGAAWRERYDRLHLHTPRVQSRLPGLRIPRRFGRWVSRADMVTYLEAYARHHGIHPRFGVAVERVDRAGGCWRVATSAGLVEADVVVIATGYNAVPFVPPWPGRDRYDGEFLHASAYRNGRPFADRDVLVVGAGNTGAEVAVDLVEHGARRVRLAVRSAPHVVPRTVVGIPTTLLGLPNHVLPARVGDPVNRLLQRLTVGDLAAHGFATPTDGLIERFRTTDVVPIIDVGLVQALRTGRVEVVPAVVGFASDSVRTADGRSLAVDAVIAATGYRTGLDRLVGHLEILDAAGRPTVPAGRTHPVAPDLHFVGMRNPLIGLLNAIRLDADRVARAVAAAGTPRAGRPRRRRMLSGAWHRRR